MAQSLSRRLTGRTAAVLFGLAGTSALLTATTPSYGVRERVGAAILGGIGMSTGVFAWCAPWDRWPRSASLCLPVIALAVMAATPLVGAETPYLDGLDYLATFVWVGIAHRPTTSAKLAPVALAAWLIPFAVTGQSSLLPLGIPLVGMCVGIGEALSWLAGRLRWAEQLNSERLDSMQGLVTSGGALAREHDAAAIAELSARLAERLLHADGALVLLAADDALVASAATHWPDPTRHRLALGDDPDVDRAIASGEPLAVRCADASAWPLRGWPAAVLIPLKGASGTLGIILLGISDQDLQLDPFGAGIADTFANQVVLALERVRATSALVDASLQDPLTGVLNRRAADLAVRRLVPGDAVALIDVDRFKEVNDTYGHAAGDEALRRFAAFLSDRLREQDDVARYGGDEFLIVLRGVWGSGASAVARLQEGWDGPITFSAGVALHVDGARPTETLRRSDEALYRAKAQGRDRVCADAMFPLDYAMEIAAAV